MIQKLRAIATRLPARPTRNALSQGIVSISFDDFPASAGHAGASILEEFGLRGTYYVSGCYEGKMLWGLTYFRSDDLARLAENGHEIACHTFSHLRLDHCSTIQIKEDLERNREFFRVALPGYTVRSFAYPNGNVGKRSLVGRAGFENARGVQPGIDQGRFDLLNLHAWPFYRDTDLAPIQAAFDAISAGGWINIFTHDVSDDPTPYGCTPAQLKALVAEIGRRGLMCVPVGTAAQKVASLSD